MSDNEQLSFNALPKCGVLDCYQMARVDNGDHPIILTIGIDGHILHVKAHIFLCSEHSDEYEGLSAKIFPYRS